MNLNPLKQDIFTVIEEKGFHNIQHTQLETLTFRQLLHLVTEWGEMMQFKHWLTYKTDGRSPGDLLAQLYEEGADIIIVALDLAGLHHLDLGEVRIEGMPVGILDAMCTSIPVTIGQLGDRYRKERVLDPELLIELITTTAMILKRHGADPLGEVEKKMARNRERPARYGTLEATA